MSTEKTPFFSKGGLHGSNLKGTTDFPPTAYQNEELQREVQRGFLRKLLVTVGMCWAVMAHPAINTFVLKNTSFFTWGTFIPALVLIFCLHSWKHSYPLNISLLAAFTVVESAFVASICAAYEAHGIGYLVGIAWGITLLVLYLSLSQISKICQQLVKHVSSYLFIFIRRGIPLLIFVSLTLLVMCTEIDFSPMGLFLYPALIGMCVYSVVCYFVGIHLGYTFAFLGALLFVGFIIYDTDKIMKKMGCDDYVIACIELYMDIINLFIFILDLLGGGRR